jgi:hypothetical protein
MPTASQLGQAQHDADQLQVWYAGVAIGVGSYVLIPNTTAKGKVLNLAGIMAGSSLILMSFSAIKEAPKDKREELTTNTDKVNEINERLDVPTRVTPAENIPTTRRKRTT